MHPQALQLQKELLMCSRIAGGLRWALQVNETVVLLHLYVLRHRHRLRPLNESLKWTVLEWCVKVKPFCARSFGSAALPFLKGWAREWGCWHMLEGRDISIDPHPMSWKYVRKCSVVGLKVNERNSGGKKNCQKLKPFQKNTKQHTVEY